MESDLASCFLLYRLIPPLPFPSLPAHVTAHLGFLLGAVTQADAALWSRKSQTRPTEVTSNSHRMPGAGGGTDRPH